MMPTRESGRIVSTPDVLGGDPRIQGRQPSVFIHEQVEGRGLEQQAVAARFDLALADVYRALAYYHENPEEMTEIRARREKRHEEASDDPRIVTEPDDIDQ